MIRTLTSFFLFLFALNPYFGQQGGVSFDQIRNIQSFHLTKSIVQSLSSELYYGRNILDSNVELTVLYLENVLKSQRISPLTNNSFRQVYSLNNKSNGYNVVGIYKGNPKKKEAILVTANFDNLGIISDNLVPDQLYNGANDNASGVAALIQFALLVSKTKTKQNFIFGFTSGKRFSLCGIAALAKNLESSKMKIIAEFNIEMIGKKHRNLNNQLFIRNESSIKVDKLFNDFMGQKVFSNYENDTITFGNYTESSAVESVLNIPSYTISTFDIETDTLYMTPKDDVMSIDFDFLHRAIQMISYCIIKYGEQ